MFEKFTDKARKVMSLAQDEARNLGQMYVGTEHLLLALIKEGDGIAAQALAKLDVTYDETLATVKELATAETEPVPGGHIPFTPRAKRVLEDAYRETMTHGQTYIATEHLLLGIVSEGNGRAMDALRTMGVSGDAVRNAVNELIAKSGQANGPAVADVRMDPSFMPGMPQGQQGDDKGGAGGSATVGARHGRVINRLSVAGSNQVTIRVRIAEVSRTASERLGLKWNRAFSVNGNSYPLAKSPISLGAAAESLVGKDVTGILDALAEENLVSILAEPNLSVVSGETASFLAGGQLPFPVLKDEDMGIEFKDYGVLLDITPTILSDRRISMRVRPEVSEPDYASGIEMKGFILPGLRIRRAETTVELASGQSFALAGLMNNDLSQKVAKFPGLGDLPIIGALARSKSFERGESEPVIIATAYLSQPSSAPLAIPNETLRSGTPLERHLFDAAPDVAPRTQGDVHVEQ